MVSRRDPGRRDRCAGSGRLAGMAARRATPMERGLLGDVGRERTGAA